MQEHHIPSLSVTIFERGKIVESRVLKGQPGARAFQFASLSKVVAAVTALWLVDQGKLKLDEPVDKKLGDWKLPASVFTEKKRVTLRQLLSHTSGLGVSGFRGYEPSAKLPNLNQMLSGVPPANSSEMIFESEPGSQWSYSGGGYLVLQKLIETTTKKPYSEVAKTEVFDTAKLAQSGYALPSNPTPSHDELGKPISANIYPEFAAAGLWSTTDDYARFLMAIPSLLKATTFKQMMTTGSGNWGLGVGLRGPTFWHSGRNRGFDTLFIANQDCQSGVVLAINTNNDTGFFDEVSDAVFRTYKWPGAPPFNAQTVENVGAQRLDALAGMYKDDLFGNVNVARDGFRLFANVPNRGWVPLNPRSQDSFFGPGIEANFFESSMELKIGKRRVTLKRN